MRAQTEGDALDFPYASRRRARQPLRSTDAPHVLTAGGGLGALVFFAVPGSAWTSVWAFALAALLFAALTRSGLFWICLGAMLVAGAGAWRVQNIGTVAPPAPGPYSGAAELKAQAPHGEAYRLVFHVAQPDGVMAVRLVHDQRLTVGATYQVAFWATPLSGPLYPGGYDARFRALFDGVQGVGRLQRVQPLVPVEVPKDGLRLQVHDRIQAALPGAKGAVVSAMLTGLRGSLDSETRALFQGAGLSHLLAISGLHLSLLAGFVFACVRGMFWAVPRWALYVDQRKVAMVLAMAAALGYFFLSGGAVPTQRALILVLATGCALLLGRQALSWRFWSLALFLVLLLGPHQVFSVSTHLSFLAVAVLIRASHFFQDWARGTEDRLEKPLHPLARWGGGLVVTTLAVNLLTLPILLLVFQSAPTLGVVANMVAVPLAGFVLIPLAFVGLLAMPLGLEGGPLWLVGQGLDLLFGLAHWIQMQPGSLIQIRAAPAPLIWPLLLGYGLVLGAKRLASWRLGLGTFLICVTTSLPTVLPRPTSLHHPDGWILVRSDDGTLEQAGLEDLSAYDFSQARELWFAGSPGLDQAKTVPKADQTLANQASEATGPILFYGDRRLEARWLHPRGSWLRANAPEE